MDRTNALEQLRSLLPPGTHENLRRGGEPGLNNETLHRWLVARKWDVQVACQDLTAHAAWRASFVSRGRIMEDEIQNQLAQNKSFLQGLDTNGAGVLYVIGRNHLPADMEECTRFIVYNLDAALRLSEQQRPEDGKFAGVMDLTGYGMRNYELGALKAIFELLSKHYVERLTTLYIYEASTLFWTLWQIVYPFIDTVTRKKIVFVYAKQGLAGFPTIPAEVLPQQVGGKAALRPTPDVWRELLNPSSTPQGKEASPQNNS